MMAEDEEDEEYQYNPDNIPPPSPHVAIEEVSPSEVPPIVAQAVSYLDVKGKQIHIRMIGLITLLVIII